MLYIRKNGIFYDNGFNTESDEYIMNKVDSIIPYLCEIINIDSGVTMEDIFNILEKDEEIINIIFGSYMSHYPLRPYIDEIRKDCMSEGKEEFEYIEMSWEVNQFDYSQYYEKFKDNKNVNQDLVSSLDKPTEDEVNHISIEVDIHGWGPYSPNDDINNTTTIIDGDHPTHTSYGIEFTPLYRLKHLPIKLDNKFIIKEDRYDGEEHVIVRGEREFTVLDIFGALLSEITFAGLPEDRDEQWKDVVDSIEEMKKKLDDEHEEE